MYSLRNGKSKPINLLSAYATTMQAVEEVKEQFYNNFDEVATQVPANEGLIVTQLVSIYMLSTTTKAVNP